MDQFAWWRSALEGKRGDIQEDKPQPGYYRNRRRGQQAMAVAYWHDTNDGSLRCKIDSADVDEMRAMEAWPFASKEPVTYEAYKAKRETGNWPDMDETIQPARGNIGDNNPPDESDADAIKRQIDAAGAGVSQYAKIGDDETKAKAQSLRSRLLELAGQAKKTHKKIKDPLWEQVKEIDNTYLPLVKEAEELAKKIRTSMDNYDTEQLRKHQEAERIAREEREEIERKAAEAARKAEAEGKPAPAPPPPMPEAPPPFQPTTTKGAYGRAASNKIVKTVTEVTDWNELFGFLKTHAELKELMLKLAQRAVDKNFDVPGVKIEDRVKNT